LEELIEKVFVEFKFFYLLLKTMITVVLLYKNRPLKNDPQNIFIRLNSNLGDFFRIRSRSIFKEHDDLIKHTINTFIFV
jgi:hypothetical protein